MSDPRTIAVFLDDAKGSAGRLRYAFVLAESFHAHLIGIFVESMPTSAYPDAAAAYARGGGIEKAIHAYYEPQEACEERVRHRLDAFARATSTSVEWRRISAQTPLRDAAKNAAYADLLLLGPHRFTSDDQPWSSADVVLASGVPGIVVPDDAVAIFPTRVMVAWNASRVARRAIVDALPFLRRAALVTIVVVDAKIGATGHGEEPGSDIARYLARHDVRTAVELVDAAGAETGSVLNACAAVLGADLVVAGAYGHSRIVEIVVGSTTRHVLRDANIPFFISH